MSLSQKSYLHLLDKQIEEKKLTFPKTLDFQNFEFFKNWKSRPMQGLAKCVEQRFDIQFLLYGTLNIKGVILNHR